MSEIRGEYWIIDGSVQFADGDIGDLNHEGYAIQHVLSLYASNVQDLANHYDLEMDVERYGEIDSEKISDALSAIMEIFEETMTEQQAYARLEKELDAKDGALEILMGGGDARFWVMVHEGWIAVRDNNAELYYWDVNKKESLANGIGEILWDEGHGNVDPEEVEIDIYDHHSGRSFSMTLAQLEQPVQTIRPHVPVTGTYNRTFFTKDTEENKYSQPQSRPNPWNVAAQQADIIGPGQELWRGTSESKIMQFKKWLVL